MKKFILLFILLLAVIISKAQHTITFPSKDGVMITADEYMTNDTLPYMILCHQDGYSRGEYKESAVRFQKLRYNCLAIDLRSGKTINDVKNETAFAAIEGDKPSTELDAEQDILAAIDYVYSKTNKRVILAGSSYSASLALKIASNNDKVRAVLAFSPGEYFGDKLVVKNAIGGIDKPVFITSSQQEAPEVTRLVKDVKPEYKTQFVPNYIGEHGSKTLWKSLNPNSQEYWMAIILFMHSLR